MKQSRVAARERAGHRDHRHDDRACG